MVNGVNLDRKQRPVRSDPGDFRRKLTSLVGSARTVGGRVTEMDTSTPPSDGTNSEQTAESLAALDLAALWPDTLQP